MLSAKSITRWTLAGACVIALSLSASSAFGLTKCQNLLTGISSKHGAAAVKAVQACGAAVRKAQSGKTKAVTVSASDSCSKAVGKLSGARAKSIGKCMGDASKTPCQADILNRLGHAVSAQNAPGGQANEWACRYSIETAEHNALSTAFAANPQLQSQIAAAAEIAAPGSDIDTFFRSKPNCATHACRLRQSDPTPRTLAAISGYLGPGSPATIPLGDFAGAPITGSLLLDVCHMGPPLDGQVLLTGSHSRGIAPVNIGSILPGTFACVSTLAISGFCHCSGAAPPGLNPTLCRDSDTTSDGVDDCLPATYPAILNSEPDSSPFAGIHTDGPLRASFTGPHGVGSCSGRLALAFKLVGAGDVGPDGTACTPDDTVAPLPATGLPFTTGHARAILFSANGNTGDDIDTNTFLGPPLNLDGAGVACGALRSSNLSGLSLVGTGPLTNAALPTGDSALSVRLMCQ